MCKTESSNPFEISTLVEEDKLLDEELSSMITPIATSNFGDGRFFSAGKNMIKSLLGREERNECELASVTN